MKTITKIKYFTVLPPCGLIKLGDLTTNAAATFVDVWNLTVIKWSIGGEQHIEKKYQVQLDSESGQNGRAPEYKMCSKSSQTFSEKRQQIIILAKFIYWLQNSPLPSQYRV